MLFNNKLEKQLSLYVVKWVFDTSAVDLEKIKKIDDEKLEIEHENFERKDKLAKDEKKNKHLHGKRSHSHNHLNKLEGKSFRDDEGENDYKYVKQETNPFEEKDADKKGCVMF